LVKKYFIHLNQTIFGHFGQKLPVPHPSGRDMLKLVNRRQFLHHDRLRNGFHPNRKSTFLAGCGKLIVRG
jgi:hypothetical protein